MTGQTERPVLALTGATGLVGRAVLRAAAGRGVAVRALYRTRPGPEGAEWVRGDLSDEAALRGLCDGATAVLHVAGATASLGDRGFHEVNVVGAARIAEAARQAGAGRFVLVSSQAARAPALSAYARSKRLGETAVRRAVGEMPVAVVRPPAVFGPGDEATEPLLAALRRGLLPVPGGRGWRGRRFAAIPADALAEYLLDAAMQPSQPQALSEPASYPDLSWEAFAGAAATAGHPARLLPVPPFLLRMAGLVCDFAARVTRRPAVFGAGKAREMLHSDWRAAGPAVNSPPLAAALRPLLGTSRADQKILTRAQAGQGRPLTRHS
ncbi:NAD-dependent epimerase/dehydratase family protein [Parvularcula dongshanensis]|uniref:Uncharacterized protein YbjT (DUF2867 family) n=1 Tax=Parvularcula dongshanensis TaxID=1173995 RepID=A0A840I568_9PROT|nr:NAD-dependent epimerase/dehydratase family protein [Parvularcula dongshanensis]MBB4659170.1 uncharacterized protein YbjT (DUF2867 family) [Parvularcula dongshanensis]